MRRVTDWNCGTGWGRGGRDCRGVRPYDTRRRDRARAADHWLVGRREGWWSGDGSPPTRCTTTTREAPLSSVRLANRVPTTNRWPTDRRRRRGRRRRHGDRDNGGSSARTAHATVGPPSPRDAGGTSATVKLCPRRARHPTAAPPWVVSRVRDPETRQHRWSWPWRGNWYRNWSTSTGRARACGGSRTPTIRTKRWRTRRTRRCCSWSKSKWAKLIIIYSSTQRRRGLALSYVIHYRHNNGTTIWRVGNSVGRRTRARGCNNIRVFDATERDGSSATARSSSAGGYRGRGGDRTTRSCGARRTRSAAAAAADDLWSNNIVYPMITSFACYRRTTCGQTSW